MIKLIYKYPEWLAILCAFSVYSLWVMQPHITSPSIQNYSDISDERVFELLKSFPPDADCKQSNIKFIVTSFLTPWKKTIFFVEARGQDGEYSLERGYAIDGWAESDHYDVTVNGDDIDVKFSVSALFKKY